MNRIRLEVEADNKVICIREQDTIGKSHTQITRMMKKLYKWAQNEYNGTCDKISVELV